MRRMDAARLAKQWEGGAFLKGARLPGDLARSIEAGAGALLRALALPRSEDESAREELGDAGRLAGLLPLFKGVLAWADGGARGGGEREALKRAGAAERSAQLRGMAPEGVDALWELALREAMAEERGFSEGQGQWRGAILAMNARGGLSSRLGWALLELQVGELFHENAPMWAAGGWGELIEGAALGAMGINAQLRAREEEGEACWAGGREWEIARALMALVEVGAVWPAGAAFESAEEREARESQERGEDAEIQQLRAEWAMGRRGGAGAGPEKREQGPKIKASAIEESRKAVKVGPELMDRVERAKAAGQAARATNVKTRRV